MTKETSKFVGIHYPTEENPNCFVYPSSEECALIARGEASAEFGCPHVAHNGTPYCSCQHGLDSYICEYAVQK